MTHEAMLEKLSEPPDQTELAEKLTRFSGLPMNVYISLCVRAGVDPEDNEVCAMVNTECGHCITFGTKDGEELGIHFFSTFTIAGFAVEQLISNKHFPDDLEWDVVPLMMFTVWDKHLLQLHKMGLLSVDSEITMLNVCTEGGTIVADLTDKDVKKLIMEHSNDNIDLYMDGRNITKGAKEAVNDKTSSLDRLGGILGLGSSRKMFGGSDDDWKERLQ